MATNVLYCRSCKEHHVPPVGKQCATRIARMGLDINPSQLNQKKDDGSSDKVISLLTSMKGDFDDMRSRLSELESSVKKRPRSDSIPSDGDASESSGSEDGSPSPKKKKARNNKKKGKSGRDKTALEVVCNDVDWPHFYVISKTDRRPATYDSLSVEQFVYGYLKVIAKEKDAAVKAAMMSHLEELMLDTNQYGWPQTRAFHAVILGEMERGSLDWLDKDGFAYNRLRKGYVTSPVTRSQTQPRTQTQAAKIEICSDYNSGECPSEKSHDGLKHACRFCYLKSRRTYKHPESECRNKKSKNDQAAKNSTSV